MKTAIVSILAIWMIGFMITIGTISNSTIYEQPTALGYVDEYKAKNAKTRAMAQSILFWPYHLGKHISK